MKEKQRYKSILEFLLKTVQKLALRLEKVEAKNEVPKNKKTNQDMIDPTTQIHEENCYVCWVFQRLNLRVALGVRTASQVHYPSNQKEQEAHADQGDGLLVDVRHQVQRDHSPSAWHPP